MLSSMNLIPHERCTADFIINRAVVAVLLTRTIYIIFSERAVWGVGGGGMLPDFFFCSLFPVQQTTSGIGHRVK